MSYCLILDIGKTNVKLHVLDENRKSVFSESRGNKVLVNDIYPCADVDGIWQWMIEVCQRLSSEFTINAISITTHGATAALIDRNTNALHNGLVIPILDYEYTGINFNDPAIDLTYETLRPDFAETFSPALPAGLNLARQLHWLEKTYPIKFASATDILMYPQYWAWRLTGQRCSEITSLGCHTDLWAPESGQYSSLVVNKNWLSLFPQIKPAWTRLGEVSSDVADLACLSQDCQVYAGLHDSNASFLRYRLFQQNKPFTVISTGTWTILMSSGVPISKLSASKDMLANVDAMAQPIACARFMGGREFEAICSTLGGAFGDPVESVVLQGLIDKGCMALPDFSEGSGPFGGRTAEFVGEISAQQGTEIATLYCALMIDYQLDNLAAIGDIFIEGAFLQNPLLCSIVAQLRPAQSVWLSADATGTVQGCAYLADWQNKPTEIDLKPAIPTRLTNLIAYKNLWIERCEPEGTKLSVS